MCKDVTDAVPSYHQWTEIAFAVAQSKGVEVDAQPPNQASDIVSIAAEVWQEDPAAYKAMSRSEARSVLRDEIAVS
jgi:hypothetical protein